MGLSFGIPLGILMSIGGYILLSRTSLKVAGRGVLGLGLVLILLTLLLVVLAASSDM